jgi:DNA polymerase-1
MATKVLIFDGLNTFLRNFAVNPHMDENGNSVGGLVGTIRNVKMMIREVKPDRVFVVWDGQGGSRKRRGIYSEYKAGRKPRLNRTLDEDSARQSKENMEWQLGKTKQLLGLVGVSQIEIDDIEADDAIGYLVGYLDPIPKVVVSSDKDMWQLISPTTIVFWPTKKVYITEQTFNEHVSCLPGNFVLMRAMTGRGDASDNIRGIKGLGEKTILKYFPVLGERVVTLDELLFEIKRGMEAEKEGPKKRWSQAVLDAQDLLSQNVHLMQLTSPIISPHSAGIIRNVVENMQPSFNFTNFKIALINNAIQLTDVDLMTTFKEYQVRAIRDETR